MKTEVRKVYQCEHCKRRMVSAGAMSRHERFCRYNPNNRHKCFDLCEFLERKTELINEHKDPTNPASYRTVFTCSATGQRMYSYLLEKRANYKPEFIEGLVRMPVDRCGDYRDWETDRKSTRLNSSHSGESRMPSSA